MADIAAQVLKRRWEQWKHMSRSDQYAAVIMAWAGGSVESLIEA
jgi:hypothetical protein